MQPHDPQPMALQQHGGRIKVSPREAPSSPPAAAVRTAEPSADCKPQPQPRESD
jgi:hypothetical protein